MSMLGVQAQPDRPGLPAGPALAIPQLLQRAVSLGADRLALIDGERRITYGLLSRLVDDVACGLRRLGLRQGEHAAILMPNSADWVIAFFAIARLGAIPVGINTRYKTPEIEHLLHHSDARLLVMSDGFRRANIDYCSLVSEIVPLAGAGPWDRLPMLRHVVVSGKAPPRAVPFDSLFRSSAIERAALDEIAIDIATPALTVYTSGTTGRPKGCQLSHLALNEAGRRRLTMMPWDADDVNLVTTPFPHIGGTNGAILATVFVGATLVLMQMFDAAEALRLIEVERVTMFYGVPTMYRAMLDHPASRTRNLRSLVKGSIGSAPVPVDLMHRILDPQDGLGVDVLVGYGQTEACGVTHHTRRSDSAERRVTTVGQAAQGIADRIVGLKTGRDCVAGEEGEICVRTSQVMLGYYKDSAATAERLRDGWLHTGDVGVQDPDGYVRITGRVADTVIVGGFNAYPVEIENCLAQHPAVREVAVIGVPDKRLGEVVMAWVVPDEATRFDAADVMAFARDRIANFKVPRRIETLRELPLNEAGKVQKQVLRKWAAERPPAGLAVDV
jgi:acyl-CoA synthetase (AMP-forming)/AMP-acid ligase II